MGELTSHQISVIGHMDLGPRFKGHPKDRGEAGVESVITGLKINESRK